MQWFRRLRPLLPALALLLGLVVPRTALANTDPRPIYDHNSSLCLAIKGGSTTAGALALQWNCEGHPDQLWKMTAVNGAWEIHNDNSGLCLGIGGGVMTQGAPAVQWDCVGHPDQRWQMKGLDLLNVNSGLCLAVYGASTTQGAQVVQWACQGHPDQEWSMPPCWGPSCVGKSPLITNSQGLDCTTGARDLQSVNAPGEGPSNSVVLRWSPFCVAKWARWTGSSGSGAAESDFFAESRDGKRADGDASLLYSAMVDGTQSARAGIVMATFNESQCPDLCAYTDWL